MEAILNFFESCLNSEVSPTPEELYKSAKQAFINETWENTAVKSCIEEQDIGNEEAVFKDFDFHCVDAWKSYVVGQTSSGSKNGDDFVQLNFRDIEHECMKGRYYKFNDNYWLAYYTNEFDGIGQSLAVRRCNSAMRIVDPQNGEIYSAPCVIDYDMSAPSTQVSRYIITPNNHAVVKVQGNPTTYRLFKTNTRFIFGGRPFKIYGIQNAILDNLASAYPTLMSIDLFLDEIHAKDDLENQLADNGEYKYEIKIENSDMKVVQGSSGKLFASVLLNGLEVDREVIWQSNSKSITVSDNGEYNVTGRKGIVKIKAFLKGNESIYDEIELSIESKESSLPEIKLSEDFTKIRECETIKSEVKIVHNGKEYTPDTVSVSLSDKELILNNKFLTIGIAEDVFAVTCSRLSTDPIKLYIKAENKSIGVKAEKIKTIELVSMFG